MNMMWARLASVLAISLAMPAIAAPTKQATPPAPAIASPGYTIPATQMFDLKSDYGDVYRIFVSYPTSGKVPPLGYPVLYVLDGNAIFGSFAEARRLEEYALDKSSIVVGVGYPTDMPYDDRRLNDLTAPLVDPAPPAFRELAKMKSGGQDIFLDFLTGKLRTEIGRRFKIDPDRQSLFGHSLGGIFAVHTLFTRPNAFYSLVAASPSMEWNEQGSLVEERAFAAALTSGKITKPSRLLVVTGGRDTDDDPHAQEAFARRMDLLSGYGLRSRLRHYDEEVHIMVPTRAVTDVLRFVSEGF